MVGDVRLMVREAGEPQYFRMYRPRHYPAHISGRLDDWVVPLPAGASYGLLLQASDFEGRRSVASFPAATLAVRLAVRAPSTNDRSGGRYRIWTNKDALVSNTVRVPDDCR